VLWATGLTLLGYFLGGIEFLQHNIEAAVLVIVFVSVLPMALEYWRHRRSTQDRNPV
jgi:membrane-associated protein